MRADLARAHFGRARAKLDARAQNQYLYKGTVIHDADQQIFTTATSTCCLPRSPRPVFLDIATQAIL